MCVCVCVCVRRRVGGRVCACASDSVVSAGEREKGGWVCHCGSGSLRLGHVPVRSKDTRLCQAHRPDWQPA